MRFRAMIRTMGLLALEGGALLALHSVDVPGVDWAHPGQWLDHVAPDDAVVAVVRLLALGTVWYLAGTTALYALANLSRLPGLIRGVRVLTLPGIRRVVEGVMVASLVAAPPAVLLTPAVSHAQAPTAAQALDYVPSPAGDPSDLYVPTPAALDPGTPAPEPGSYEVKPGDNLWGIAAAHLAARSGRAVHELSEAEIRPVWLAVVKTNAATLTSGNPDLIFLGEVLVIPAP